MNQEILSFIVLFVSVVLFFAIIGVGYLVLTKLEKQIVKAYNWYLKEYTRDYKIHWRHYYTEDFWTCEGFEIIAATNESGAIRTFRSRYRSDYKIMGVNKV